MPIAMDPAQKVPIWLTIDSDKAEAIRPVFFLRYLTSRQAIRLQELIEQANDPAVPQKDQSKSLNKALAVQIVEWKNLNDQSGNPVLFRLDGEAGDELSVLGDDVLTAEEKWELVLGGLRKIRLSESDRKKSASQPATATNESAPAAPKGV